MMRHSKCFGATLLILIFTNCSFPKKTENLNAISQLQKFKTAKDIIFRNLDTIEKNLHADSTWVHPNFTFSANKFFYENSIAKKSPELKKILSLWNEALLPDSVNSQIIMSKDSILYFEVYTYIGTFTGVEHYIYFDINDVNTGLDTSNSNILSKRALGNHWYYLIRERSYVD